MENNTDNKNKVLGIILIVLIATAVVLAIIGLASSNGNEFILLTQGDTYELGSEIKGGNVTYTSSNEYVAVVSEAGKVEAVQAGYVTITVTLEDGTERTYDFEVEGVSEDIQEENKVTVKISKEEITIKNGEEYQLSYELSSKYNGKAEWKSSNPNVAEVSQSGRVKAKKTGKTTITIKLKNGNKASCKVNVIANTVKEKSISLNSTSLNLKEGNNYTLQVSFNPSNTSDKSITWSSSNKNVADVSNGKVTAKKEGTATITAKSKNGKNASVKITVVKNSVEINSISLNTNELNMYIDDTKQLTITLSPSNATNTQMTWSSSNNNIATVSNGLVTAKGKGTATITAKSKNGKTATAKITVNERVINPSQITINKTATTLTVGDEETLTATISPSNATNKKVTWTSNNQSVVKVANGKLTSVGVGTATVTATTENGKTSSCNVTVKLKTINVSSIALNQKEANLNIGKTVQLSATVMPQDATNKTVTWSSSNNNVATVSNGLVTAKGEGTAKISASAGGKSVEATIKVTKPANTPSPKPSATPSPAPSPKPSQDTTIAVSSVSLNKTSETIYVNTGISTVQLTATVSPSNATKKTVTWKSSNTNVATVDSSGKVTIKGLGQTQITATSNNNKSATYTLTVKKKVVIEAGASQSTRLNNYVSKCTYNQSGNTYTYAVGGTGLNKDALVHVQKGGAKMTWVYNTSEDGYKLVESALNAYSNQKEYVEFYIYYLIIGNSFYPYSCSDIGKDKPIVTDTIDGYNKAIKNYKKAGYNIQKTYIVSMHPVKPTEAKANGKTVTNSSSKYCDAGMRSNWKYHKYNTAIKNYMNEKNYANLTYVETFTKIMDISKATKDDRTYTYKVTYHTSDGVHWDEPTAKYYMGLMMTESKINTSGTEVKCS